MTAPNWTGPFTADGGGVYDNLHRMVAVAVRSEGIEQRARAAAIADALNGAQAARDAVLEEAAGVADQFCACRKCGAPASGLLVMTNIEAEGDPMCRDCLAENEAISNEINDHEMRNFGGAYGLVTYRVDPLPSAAAAIRALKSQPAQTDPRVAALEAYEDAARIARLKGWPDSMSEDRYLRVTEREEAAMDCADEIAAAILRRAGRG